MKVVFSIFGLGYNRGGWVEYQLVDELTGSLYRHGAYVRERDLRPGN
jgi:hypothetical protein